MEVDQTIGTFAHRLLEAHLQSSELLVTRALRQARRDLTLQAHPV